MWFYFSVVTEKIVVYGAVFAVSYRCLQFLLRVLFVGVDHIVKDMAVIDNPGSHFSGRYDFLFTLDSPMRLITQF